jgi:hypothetical protein
MDAVQCDQTTRGLCSFLIALGRIWLVFLAAGALRSCPDGGQLNGFFEEALWEELLQERVPMDINAVFFVQPKGSLV